VYCRGFGRVRPECRTNLYRLHAAYRDPTAWLGREDSNSEMSSQNIPLKGRTVFRGSSRIPAAETIRVPSCDGGRRSSAGISAGCLRWQELPRFSADPFRLAGVRCIAALWRLKSLLRHRSDSPEMQIDHRPDGLRRRPPCCFSVASWPLRTRRHGIHI
jgi:hypothetical protein